MAHPAVNTKVEQVVESIEDMVIAVSARDHDAALVARTECANALREFLAPTLRLVSGNSPQ